MLRIKERGINITYSNIEPIIIEKPKVELKSIGMSFKEKAAVKFKKKI